MKKISILLLPIILLVLVPSCKDDNDTTPLPLEIFPLKIGNHWTFRTTLADSTISTHVNDVVKDTLIDHFQWFILTYDTVIRTICRNTSSGWWFLYEGKSPVAMKQDLYWKYPATVNEQYMTADSTLVTVVSVTQSITVPAGNFNCYHYHMIHYKQGYECEEYLAPGFGLIKHTVYAPGSGISKIAEITELLSYSLL